MNNVQHREALHRDDMHIPLQAPRQIPRHLYHIKGSGGRAVDLHQIEMASRFPDVAQFPLGPPFPDRRHCHLHQNLVFHAEPERRPPPANPVKSAVPKHAPVEQQLIRNGEWLPRFPPAAKVRGAHENPPVRRRHFGVGDAHEPVKGFGGIEGHVDPENGPAVGAGEREELPGGRRADVVIPIVLVTPEAAAEEEPIAGMPDTHAVLVLGHIHQRRVGAGARTGTTGRGFLRGSQETNLREE